MTDAEIEDMWDRAEQAATSWFQDAESALQLEYAARVGWIKNARPWLRGIQGALTAAKTMRGSLIGHEGHWYPAEKGEGCPLCIAQREAADVFDEAMRIVEGGSD